MLKDSRHSIFGLSVATLVSIVLGSAFPPLSADPPSLDDMMSSGEQAAARARSSVLDAGGAPVAAEGVAKIRVQGHRFTDYAPYIEDTTWITGEESRIEYGFIARPNRHARMWAGFKLMTNFQGGMLPDRHINTKATSEPGFYAQYSRHDSDSDFIRLEGDFYTGVGFAGRRASFYLRLGGRLWVKSSPLSVWSGTKTISIGNEKEFGWTYFTWEDDAPVADWYEMRVLKGERFGEAATRWTKQAFRGVNIESVNLPGNVYLNLLLAPGTIPARARTFGPEILDHPDVTEKTFDDNHYLFHSRVAWDGAAVLGRDLTIGLNTVFMRYNDNVAWSDQFLQKAAYPTTASGRVIDSVKQNVYNERTVVTVDVAGEPVPKKLEFIADIGACRVDSHTVIMPDSAPRHSKSASRWMLPAMYGRLRSEFGVPLQLEGIFVPEGYHSYTSFPENISGANLSYRPTIEKGRLKVTYGVHTQIKARPDLLIFPYKLNGPDQHAVFLSTYGRWGFGELDILSEEKYDGRLGIESGKSYERGTVRSNYMALAETFVPYDNRLQASVNANDTLTGDDAAARRYAQVPVNKQWAFNLGIEAATDIGTRLGWGRRVLLNGFAQIRGVDKAFLPLAFSQKDIQLWGGYLRFEPAVALTEKFYLLGLSGFEWWRSDKAYRETEEGGVERMPIDFRDYAFGVGFDLDITAKVGLHGRYKWCAHDDINVSENNWQNLFMMSEIAVWF